jgi:hypothetical protein
MAVDSLRTRLTGLSNLKLKIRRISDGFYFDWSDDNFKASPTQLLETLTAVDATNSPGEYKLDNASHTDGFDTGAIVNPTANDIYRVAVIQDGLPQNAVNFPQIGEIKVGGWLDYIDQLISDNASPAEVLQALRDFGLDHLVSVNPGIVPPAAGTYIRQILDNQDSLLARPVVYSLQQNWSYNKATDTLIGQIWVESANLVVTAPTSCSVTWYDDTETAMFTITDPTPDARGVFLVTKSTPNLQGNKAYYAEASLTVPGFGTVKAIKGSFTVGT